MTDSFQHTYIPYTQFKSLMITIIGVAHVFDIKDRLREEIFSRDPDVVAVELDRARYHALMDESSRGGAPLMYRAMAQIQKKIGDKYGVQPGSEMKEAVEAARRIGAAVAFIDIPATYTFKRLMDSMSMKEKVYFLGGIIGGLFVGKKKIDKEIKRYQENEESYMKVVEENMPSVSRVLIDERNTFMAKHIIGLEERFEHVLAVVGDGHVRGLIKELEGEDVKVIRLKEVMEPGDKSQVTFSYELRSQ